MQFIILGSGTSTGVPVPGCDCPVCRSTDPRNSRLRTAAALRLVDGRVILIDTATDLRQQTLKYAITRVDAVLYTHAHADHILGLDDLRCFNLVSRASIPCYATPETLNSLRATFAYVFDQNSSYQGGLLPQLDLIPFNAGERLLVCDTPIQSLQLLHGSLEVVGFRIGNLGYATDCNYISPKSKALLHGVETLILDGLRHEPHRTHFTIKQAVAVAQEIGARQTYLIHMSHSIDHATVCAQLPTGISLAYDGLTVEVRTDETVT